jgi:hypothetical protein
VSAQRYLYCVTPPDHTPPAGLLGLDDSPVAALPAGSVAIWSSLHERPPSATEETVRRHNQVVEAAMTRTVTPVPLRFGQIAPDDGSLARTLAADADRWESLLEEFAGCVEYGVRVLDAAGPASTSAADRPSAEAAVADGPGRGRRHMEALAARSRRLGAASPMLAVIHEETGALVRSERVEPLHGPHGFATIAHLVERTAIPEYTVRIRRAAERLPTLSFLHSGPWPPYSFIP